MKKITLVHGWHDDNKGDSAIMLGTIKYLVETIDPDAKINILTINNSIDNEYAIRHLKKSFPGIAMTVNPYPSGLNGAKKYFEYFFKSWFNALFNIQDNGAVGAILDSDLIIVKGGHIFQSSKNVHPARAFIGALCLIYPIFIAKKNRIPVVLLGHSVGPYNNFFDEFIFKTIYAWSKVNFLREQISYDDLLRLHTDPQTVKLTPDMAFALDSQPTKADDVLFKYELQKHKFAVITVRSSSVNDSMTKDFLKEIQDLIESLIEKKLVEKIAIVAHTHGPTPVEDDRSVSRQLYFHFRNNAQVVLIEDDYSPQELINFYGNAQFLIGTRFHSVIFALLSGTPVFSVSYAGPKAEGIMKKLNLEARVQKLDKFDHKLIIEEVEKMDFQNERNFLIESIGKIKTEFVESQKIIKTIVDQ
jgi:colanic acid/amylovoran biosynthesis protein